MLKITISIFMFLVESAEKPDRPFRTGNLETLDWHWLGIPHSPNGAKKARKKCFFLNGVVTRSFATPLSANMMPTFRESRRGHEKFKHPLKNKTSKNFAKRRPYKNTKILSNGSSRAHFEHSGVLPGSKLHARHDGHSEIISS